MITRVSIIKGIEYNNIYIHYYRFDLKLYFFSVLIYISINYNHQVKPSRQRGTPVGVTINCQSLS